MYNWTGQIQDRFESNTNEMLMYIHVSCDLTPLKIQDRFESQFSVSLIIIY